MILIYNIILAIALSMNPPSDPITEFEVIEKNGVIEVDIKDEQMNESSLKDVLEETINEENYSQYFISDENPGLSHSSIIRVDQIRSIVDYNASEEQSIFTYIDKVSYKDYLVPLLGDKTNDYIFIKIQEASNKYYASLMGFDINNKLENILVEEKLHHYMERENIITEYRLIIITEWPRTVGIVYEKNEKTYILPFSYHSHDLKIDNGSSILLSQLSSSYKSYRIRKMVSKVFSILLIPTIILLVIILIYFHKAKKKMMISAG